MTFRGLSELLHHIVRFGLTCSFSSIIYQRLFCYSKEKKQTRGIAAALPTSLKAGSATSNELEETKESYLFVL